MLRVFVLALAAASLQGAGWRTLFNGRDLTGWESRGDGIWTVLEGVLLGQRDPKNNGPKEFPLTERQFQRWLNRQAWIYTKDEFTEYDLSLEYWVRAGGNSGVSLHDGTRAGYAIAAQPDYSKTPAHVAYEIQINHGYPDPKPSGSIYTLAEAKEGAQKLHQWNRFDIEVRTATMRVKLNGVLVAEAPTDPARPKSGPIGLQLHDMYTVAQFRNIKIRPLR
ncbi:MAG: DUF1080 domain-containing protein [Bryobacteraceae bacterium]